MEGFGSGGIREWKRSISPAPVESSLRRWSRRPVACRAARPASSPRVYSRSTAAPAPWAPPTRSSAHRGGSRRLAARRQGRGAAHPRRARGPSASAAPQPAPAKRHAVLHRFQHEATVSTKSGRGVLQSQGVLLHSEGFRVRCLCHGGCLRRLRCFRDSSGMGVFESSTPPLMPENI